MKRYRVSTLDFDTRANMLAIAIQDGWEAHIKELHRRNKEQIIAGLKAEFGEYGFAMKHQNFLDLGPKPLSVLAFHNLFSEQVRTAFVMGAYYPALVGACSLGERILNYLVLSLRDDFRTSHGYRRVARRDSFANWAVPLEVLSEWNVLRPEVVELFRQLQTLRNRAIHFEPATDFNDRPLSLTAIRTLTRIIELQFGSFGPLPWFIPDTRGAAYISKSAEADPFVRRVYIPNCDYVGPWHQPQYFHEGRVHILDEYPYEDREVTDDEFREMLSINPPAHAGP